MIRRYLRARRMRRTGEINAYCSPQYFLRARGFLELTNEYHIYRITDAGRAVVPETPTHAD